MSVSQLLFVGQGSGSMSILPCLSLHSLLLGLLHVLGAFLDEVRGSALSVGKRNICMWSPYLYLLQQHQLGRSTMLTTRRWPGHQLCGVEVCTRDSLCLVGISFMDGLVMRKGVYMASMGGIIRDHVGKAFLGIWTNYEAEFSGLIRGLQRVKELGFSKVRVESDSISVVWQSKGRRFLGSSFSSDG
ncbi:hypothetical protein NE237_008562 [Protea cynaroides]|uniref:RNase H type-1 domain-containing protein n=1 Tax=Protea cynaroides TaxID=273540 RepID=A0A9Q0KVU5_9MAGN|nr:hypothetical protein NE237_008562 [Protea cynaroides]